MATNNWKQPKSRRVQYPRFDMQSSGGVYILILRLPRPSTIKIGSLASTRLKAGWYAYVGSAWGSGGVLRRTDRHKRCEKKKHWHIDYIREYAEIIEIWFSHVDATFEHNWSKHLARLEWVEVPLANCGSMDCHQNCPTHFFRFKRRPTVSLFRSITGGDTVEAIYAQKLAARWDKSAEADWERDYWLGELLLEDSRMALYRAELLLPDARDFGKYRCNPKLAQLIDYYAHHLGTSRDSLKKAVELAAAVDSLIESLGTLAFDVLFLQSNKQSRKDIMKISRKSIERQRERFEKVAAGRAMRIAPCAGDEAPDTMTFAKFFSRLGRARGPVVQTQMLKVSGVTVSADDVDKISKLLSSYRAELLHFKKLVRELEPRPEESRISRRDRKETKPAKSVRRLQTQLSTGLAMLKKNNRDLPRSSYDLRPTPSQRQRLLEEIDELIRIVKVLQSDWSR
jgi:Uri superfamily endonuclease